MRPAVVFIAFGLLCVAGRVQAEPRARLEYSREESAAECAEASELERAVQARLGENPFDPQGQRAFRVRLLARGEALLGLVTLQDAQGVPEGMRRFESRRGHCDELISAIALAISIAINPELADSEEPVASSEAAAPPPEAAPPPPAAAGQTPPAEMPARPPPARAASSVPGWVFAVGVEGHGAIGAGPEPTGGAGVLGRARRSAFSFGLEGRFDAPVAHPVGEAFVSSRLLGGTAVTCGHLGPAFGCGALLMAGVHADSDGVDAPDSDSGLFIAAGPRVGVGFPLGAGLSLEGRLDALVSVKRVAIVLNDSRVWESPWSSGALGAALVWQPP